MQIAIIGNGSSVLDFHAGAVIDACDEVVRFNEFFTRGFEQIVGTKTTIWGRNTGERNPHGEAREDAYKLVLVQHVRFVSQHHDAAVAARPNHQEIDPAIHDEICKASGRFDLNTSVGVQTVGHFARRYPGQVWIHGFDSFTPPRKYFIPVLNLPMPHAAEERKYLEELLAGGAIRRLRDHPDCVRSPHKQPAAVS